MADPIEEFLVNIGFNVDTHSQHTFELTIRRTQELVNALGKGVSAVLGMFIKVGEGVAGAALALQAGVVGIANSMSQLGFISQRTGASVQNIQELGFAFSQMGRSSAEARSMVEGIADTLRSNPGAKVLLSQLGVNPNEDTAKIATDLGRRLRQMPFFQAQSFAAIFHISPQELLVLERGIGQFTTQYGKDATAIGVDSNKAAAGGIAFTRAFRHLRANISMIGMRVEQTFAGRMTRDVENLRKTLMRNAPFINRVLDGLMRGLLYTEEQIGRAAVWGGSQLRRLAAYLSTLNWSGWEKDAVTAISNYSAWIDRLIAQLRGPLSSALDDIATHLKTLRPAWDGLVSAIREFLARHDWGEKTWAAIERGVIGAATSVITHIKDMFTGFIDGINHAMNAMGALLRGDWLDAWKQWSDAIRSVFTPLLKDARDLFDMVWANTFGSTPIGKEQLAAGGKILPMQEQANANYVIDQLKAQLGLTDEQAAGVTARLASESSMDPKEFNPAGGGIGARGLAQWRADRQISMEQFVASYMRDHPGSTPLQAQTQFLINEWKSKYADSLAAVRRTNTASDASAAFRPFESGGIVGPVPNADRVLRSYRESHIDPNKPALPKLKDHIILPAAPNLKDHLDRMSKAVTDAHKKASDIARPVIPPAPSIANTNAGQAANSNIKQSSFQQNTNITVHTSGDGSSIASMIGRNQSRVNADMVRRMGTVLA